MAPKCSSTRNRRKPKLSPQFIVEFVLSDAPSQTFRATFSTERKARAFVDFNEDNELLLSAALVY